MREDNTCEISCLRKAVNRTRRDHIRNANIRSAVGISPLWNLWRKRTLWFGKLVRMDPTLAAARVYKMITNRGRGGPSRG